MSKRKEPPEITKQDIEHEHPQIKRSEYSDVMSSQKMITVTIPPTGGDVSGVSNAIHQLSIDDETHLNSWERLKAAIDYDYFEKLEPFRTQSQLHLGPVQLPEMFSEKDFKRRAYLSLKHVLLTLEGMPDEQQQLILNQIAPSLFAAGRAWNESRIREAQMENVVLGSDQLTMLRENADKTRGPTHKIRKIVSAMKVLVSRGERPTQAMHIVKTDQKLGQKPDTILRYYNRYKDNLDSP